MLDKLTSKVFLIIYAILLLIVRLFYFALDNLIGVRILDSISLVLVISGIILFVIAIRQAIKKKFSALLIISLTISVFLFLPFEYLIGWTQFQFSRSTKNQIIKKLSSGFFDDTLSKLEYPQYGAWIAKDNPRFKVFKDSNLQLVFIWQGNIRSYEEYCGILYISDESKITDTKVYDFLGREFHKKKLDYNWYWVDCYIDRTPAP